MHRILEQLGRMYLLYGEINYDKRVSLWHPFFMSSFELRLNSFLGVDDN